MAASQQCNSHQPKALASSIKDRAVLQGFVEVLNCPESGRWMKASNIWRKSSTTASDFLLSAGDEQ
ncbi:Hypothetical predicted protein [Pelobates cultripes]|uniref:Uncharacterized protein n=1 Tax=Pelobates cultripes TaxID=61616 RepID=A0AAD1TAG7_PELCU|nr:Hypothetical predicted protein [Pelobates cultripes]